MNMEVPLCPNRSLFVPHPYFSTESKRRIPIGWCAEVEAIVKGLRLQDCGTKEKGRIARQVVGRKSYHSKLYDTVQVVCQRRSRFGGFRGLVQFENDT